MFSLLASTPIAQMLTRRDRPPASMPLKEESPADTGISDLPVFTDAHESTTKSTPASTFSNASQRAKPEGDDIVMALSAAGATVASVTILSDDMPATPYSLAATPRLCSPQSADAVELDRDAAVHPAGVPIDVPTATTPSADGLPSSSDAITHPLATPPEPRPSTPLLGADLAQAAATATVEAGMVPETLVDDGIVAVVETPEAPAADAMDLSPNVTPARQSRRLSSRRASSAAGSQPQSQPQPQPESETQTSPSPARRPVRAARLSARLAQESPMAAATATPVATANTAAKTKASRAKADLPSPAERRTTRLSGTVDSLFPNPSTSSLGKRGRRSEARKANVPRELRRLEDTKEFSHVDEKPVIYTVWSNGKYVPANAAGEPLAAKNAATDRSADSSGKATASRDGDDASGDSPRKRAKMGPGAAPGAVGAEEDDDQQGFFKPTTRRLKKWLDRGLYAGQPMPSDPAMGLNAAEKRTLATLPKLTESYPENKTLPMPIFTGMRLLVHGRDFKMPFDVFNPLPPGQPKPVKYGRFSKNRFVGDAHAIWRKNPDFDDFSSKCVCKPETGCDEDCQNRIMLYECDDMNCNVGPERCHNREFQRLAERTASKNLYHIGVEVFKTPDRGHGIRASRSFKPSQIIMEYIGEIITEEESDRRMNELYKNNACYYLMSFDQSLIIDGTSGSIARFVNHSCSPNCRMIKWIVSGQPRIALFAGDRPIMTGEELTYDYNFDPYSSKNVQTCLCGSENCRGILGPRKRDKAAAKAAAEKAAAEKAALLAAKIKGGKGKNGKKMGTLLGKRKLEAYNNGKEDDSASAGGPDAKKANIGTAAKRGPGRPRTPDSGKKTKSTAKVTTTKAALAALAAKAARDARVAKATKAAKAARLAKAAEAAEAAEAASPTKTAAKASKAAKEAKAGKTAKVARAARGVKVTKTARGLKAAKTTKTTTTTTKTTKTMTKKTTPALKPKPARSVGAAAGRKRNAKSAAAAERTAKGDKPGPGRKPKVTDAEQEPTPAAAGAANAGTALQATPMARALAKAAKEAAKAAKATRSAKTGEATGKTKPKAAVGKRAAKSKMTAAKAVPNGRGRAAKPTRTAKVGRPAGKTGKAGKAGKALAAKVAGQAASSLRQDETAAVETAKEGGASKLVQQKLNFATIGSSPRRKPGRPPSSKKAVKAQPVKASGPVGGKRPVGRPRGSKKAAKQAPTQVLPEALAFLAPLPSLPKLPSLPEQPSSQLEQLSSPDSREMQVGEPISEMGLEAPGAVDSSPVGAADSAEDVIHVASSAFSAAA